MPLAKYQSSPTPRTERTEGEGDRLGEREAPGREGTCRGARHPPVEVDLGDLVEGARAGGDEGGAEKRVQEEDRVEARQRTVRSRGEAEEGGEDDEDRDARLRQLEEVRQVPLHAVAGAASPAGAPAVAGAVESAWMRARRTAARTPVIQRSPPTARWAEVIATAFAVQTEVAPSVT